MKVAKGDEQEMWSTHDLACAHCRARKIKCGRERPQCQGCKRDGVECSYSSPGRRINHVKLLCQNFEALEGQLSSIRGDLSALTSLVKSNHGEIRSSQEKDTCPDNTFSLGAEQYRPNGGHILRDPVHLIDRYHSPGSLYALCRELHDDPIFNNASSDSDHSEYIRMLFQQMCADASREDHMSMPSAQMSIRLPPRQFLTSIVGEFFKTADYATDIFVQSNFQRHFDQVYENALSPVDEAWAVCFHAIILLGAGKDHGNQGTNRQFQQHIQTLEMVINNPQVFLVPRLVNVQALALLSHIAELYSPPTQAEMIFGQACLLARTMGLHQSRAIPEGLTLEEVVERHKVFRSLYIRDKNLAICRGSSPFLQTYDSRISPLSAHLSSDEAKHSPRVELAQIQDEVYRHLLSAEAPPLPPSYSRRLISKLGDRLDRWSATHQIITNTIPPSTDSASLVLSFLATRLCISRSSDMQQVSPHSFTEAKACCVALLQATDTPRHNIGVLARLSGSFPLTAFFVVTKNALQPIGSSCERRSYPEEEIQLLEALRDRFTALTGHYVTENFSNKLRCILHTMVEVVQQKKCPDAPSMSSTPSQKVSPETSPASLQTSTPAAFTTNCGLDLDPVLPSPSSLLPIMQPLDGSDYTGPYQQQSDLAGRKGKRRRLLSETELFDLAGVLGESPEDNSFLLEFLATTDIPILDTDE